jgi:hypothetical protein
MAYFPTIKLQLVFLGLTPQQISSNGKAFCSMMLHVQSPEQGLHPLAVDVFGDKYDTIVSAGYRQGELLDLELNIKTSLYNNKYYSGFSLYKHSRAGAAAPQATQPAYVAPQPAPQTYAAPQATQPAYVAPQPAPQIAPPAPSTPRLPYGLSDMVKESDAYWAKDAAKQWYCFVGGQWISYTTKQPYVAPAPQVAPPAQQAALFSPPPAMPNLGAAGSDVPTEPPF